MSDNDEFSECESLKDLAEAIVSLREAIDVRLGPDLEVMTKKEAAAYLRISKRQLERLAIERGLIAYSQLNGDGSAIRFTKTDLIEFIVSTKVPTLEEIRLDIA